MQPVIYALREFMNQPFFCPTRVCKAAKVVAPVTPPTTEAPAPAESITRNYTCPSCTTTFTVDTMERPVRITCPGCQIELIIKEDVNFA